MAARKNLDTEKFKQVRIELEKACKGIPKGKVMSYKVLAEKLNTTPTVIGTIVKNTHGSDISHFHRAVPTNGDVKQKKMTIDSKKKMDLLEKDGILFEGHVIKKECFAE
eukprot:NODE_336_length_10675_cov_0.185136.p9 type:complete len:109 gc:universal NODE_336_length_10675_cov_0.185136:7332-7006(-)